VRTVLVTNGNLKSLLSLGDFLRRYHQKIVAVFVTTRLPSERSNVIGVLSMLRKSGYRYTHFKLLTNLLLLRRLRRLGLPTTVAEYLRHLGATAPVFEVADINQPDVVDHVRSYAPEILLSFSATSRFHDPLLAIPRRAAINAHYALLPQYAGLSPGFWYLRNREPEGGVTLHAIVTRLDAGPIIEQRRFSLAGVRTVLGVLREQMACVSPLLCRYYEGITSERNTVPQDLSKRSYFRHPSRADVAALYRHGCSFYDRADLAAVTAWLQRLARPAASARVAVVERATSSSRSDSAPARVVNALTVDVEDWQSAIDPTKPVTDHFIVNTHKVLAALAAQGVHATFFVLGRVAEHRRELIREIQSAGHRVQSHGYGHQLIHTLTPATFRTDVLRAKKLLEDLTGTEVYGYRAPAFSITEATLWALDVLVETGHRYDSSIFPLRTRRYGIDGGPPYPHIARTPGGHEIREFPVASYSLAGRRVPLGGGGYFRLFPYWVLRRGVAQLNAGNRSATIYMHPYEYHPDEFQTLDQKIPWRVRLHQGLGRRQFPARIDRLLGEFRFGAIQDVIATTPDWPSHDYSAQSDAHRGIGRTQKAGAATLPGMCWATAASDILTDVLG